MIQAVGTSPVNAQIQIEESKIEQLIIEDEKDLIGGNGNSNDTAADSGKKEWMKWTKDTGLEIICECGKVRYCSEECQRLGREDHRGYCVEFQKRKFGRA